MSQLLIQQYLNQLQTLQRVSGTQRESAVLIQNRQEVIRCPVDDVVRLEKLLDLFFSYGRAEIAEFRKAVEPAGIT